jgi:NAD(P)-dependent dehydrogenase (short-subunit alcohol dehydrogenase family)
MERILITGASRGIGRAIAERLAGAGRELILHGRNPDTLAEAGRAVEQRGGRVSLVVGDLARAEDVVALAAAIAAPLHVVVNNAGSAVVKPLEAITLDEWQRSFAVAVTAPFLLAQRLLPLMPSGASIVNVLSVAARRAFPGWSAYCASKFALEGFTLSLREEVRSRGVRVINVYPAATRTALWDDIAGEWPRERMMPPGEVAEAIAFALARPSGVLVESIEVGDVSGAL